MNSKRIEQAGKELRSRLKVSFGNRSEATHEIARLHSSLKNGLVPFYEGEKVDVYVDNISDSQINIWFGNRPTQTRGVLQGPMAVVFVSPNGELLWSESEGWSNNSERINFTEAQVLDLSLSEDQLEKLFISFLEKAEESYFELVRN